jgi:hypothetical protein
VATTTIDGLTIDIGGMPIRVRTDNSDFRRLLERRYGHFATARGPAVGPNPVFDLEVELVPAGIVSDADARVSRDGERWVMERGDFRAEWEPLSRTGWVRQSANPYSIDAVLRMVHSLLLAQEGGFLVHAASSVRNQRAFLFAGVSGAGKTTISRLAPPDVTLLTDEISYVRTATEPVNGHPYVAFGTPFAGELAQIGENLRAPVAGVYLLAKGPENHMEAVGEAAAARALLRNILFFAQDADLVRLVFQSALDFVRRVPVSRLVFTPDARVWEMIH